MSKKRIGFQPGGTPELEPDDPESEPTHVGFVNQLTDSGGEESDLAAWSFVHHIYVAIQIGPFALVIGRPE